MRKFIASSLLLLAAFAAQAQNVIRVEAPNVVAADEQFNVVFIIEGSDRPSDFSWEPGSDFQVVWGPQKGSSSSTTIINGKVDKSSQTTFTYILLPKSKGSFIIPAASATVKGNVIYSPKTAIEVVSGSSSSQSQTSGGSSAQSSADASRTGDIASSDLFLRLSLSRTSVVVGEPITATLKLFQRVNIAGFEDAKFPTFNGFWSQEVQAPSNIEFKRESLGDAIYNTAVLRSWVIIPQQAGEIAIDPAELVCLVNIRVASATRSIFDSFFDDDMRTVRKRVTSERHTVKVTALPAGAPSTFGGGVGTFSISARLGKDSLKVHDAASIFVTVSGKGNVALLNAPSLELPPDFERYDVKVTDNSDKSTGKTTGSKTFEYPFIPRSHGDFQIQPIRYTYYDVNQRRYVTLETAPMSLKVSPGEGYAQPATGGTVAPGVAQRDVRDLGSDIRYITTELPSFSRKGYFLFSSPVAWLLLALMTVISAALYLILKKSDAKRADVVASRNKGATKMARKRLARAGEFLAQNLPTAFYEELHKALLGYAADKLNMNVADMSKENIAEKLSAAGCGQALCQRYVSLIDSCEYARYSPDSGSDSMKESFEEAVAAISDVDSSVKASPRRPSSAAALVAALLLTLAPWSAQAAAKTAADSLWTVGTEAYAVENWALAAESWSGIVSAGYESPELYYNIGNAFFKQGDIAHAVLNYERSLRLDPSFDDAAFNLEFANTFVQDRIDSVPEFFLKTFLRKFCHLMSSDSWMILFLILAAGCLASVLLFLRGKDKKSRMLSFFAAIALILLAIVSFSFSLWQYSESSTADNAIVTAPVCPAKSSPGSESSKDLFVIHEGTKVKVLENVGEWCNIELSDGRQGWIKSSEVEVI